jgi:hypothetical protein
MSFETEIKKFALKPIFLVEFNFPSGTVYCASGHIRFPDIYYAGKVLSIGTLRRAMTQNLGLVENATVEIQVSDTTQTFITKATTDQVKGATVRIHLGTSGLALADFRLMCEGDIDSFSISNDIFRCSVKDRLWTMPSKPDTGYINETDFPNAPKASRGKPLPLCYGTHSETEGVAEVPADGQSDFKNRGAWPTIQIDNTSDSLKWLVARHAVKSIDQVYAYTPGNGSVLLTAGDYTAVLAGTINGETMAWIQFTDAQLLASGKVMDSAGNLGVITVNCTGREDVGDGSGALLNDPVDVLKDLFANYLGDPPLNTDLFDAARLVSQDRLYQVCGGYTEEKNSDEVLRDLCNSFGIRMFPDRQGQIGISIWTVPAFDAVTSISLKEQWDVLFGSWNVDFTSDIQGAEDAQICNDVDFSYSKHWAKGFFRGAGTIEDAFSISTYGKKTLKMECPWTSNAINAQDVAARIVILYKNPVDHISCTTPLVGTLLELSDSIAVTHHSSPVVGGYSATPMEVIELTLNPETFTVQIRATNVDTITRRAFYLGDEAALPADWEAGTAAEKRYGGLCDDDSGLFPNGAEGFELL